MSTYIHLQGEDFHGCIKDILVSEDDWEMEGKNPESFVIPSSMKSIKKIATVEIDVIEGTDSLPEILKSA